MNLYAFPPFLTSLLLVGIGFYVYLRNKSSKPNIIFGLFCLSMSVWLWGFTGMYLCRNPQLALTWARNGFIGIIFIPIFAYHFIISFLAIKRSYFLIFLYLTSILGLIIHRTNYVYKDVAEHFWGYYPIAGSIYIFFLLSFLLAFSIGLLHLFLALKKKERPARVQVQIKYLLFAFGFGTTGLIDYAIKFGIDVYPWGYISAFLFISLIAYAIVAHRLMDINVVVTRGVAYGTLTAIIAGVYIGLMAGADRIFSGVAGYSPTLVHALLFIAVLFALIYVLPRMKIRAIELTRRTLFRGKYDYQQELSEATRVIPTMLNLKQLGDYVLTKIRDTMMVNKLTLFVYGEAEQNYLVSASFGLDKGVVSKIKIGENSALVGLLRDAGKPLVKEELERTGTVPEEAMELAVKQLNSLGAELCIPLMLKDDLAGIVTLSNKRNGEMYTDEDLALLATLANQVALTVEYIKAIDKISSEKRYVGLGKALMRMAHDIKNPLVPLKTFLQILPDKYPKEFEKMSEIDAEFTGRFYESALEGVDRINNLVERALHYARHPEPQFSEVKLDSLMNDVLTQEEVDLKKAKVQLQKEYNPSSNSIEADGEQLIELFSNLITNSIDAMEESPTKKLTIRTRPLNGRVVVEIIDTGCGIPKDKIDTIFDPFISYKHQGSGLGLAIVKKIVDDHKGTIEVNSEPDKGTSFKVILPRRQ